LAVFYPSLEVIKNLRQKPTEGEYHALKILQHLSDEYEIYFQPYINGYNPDIVTIRKNYGVLIIEVKDWNLAHYSIEQNDKWYYIGKKKINIKSPIKQVKAYKNDLYNLSIPSMLNKKIKDKKSYGIVQTAVYFHNETSKSLQYNNIQFDEYCPIFGNDNFTINNILQHKQIIRKFKNNLFTDDIYFEFQRILKPSFHTIEQAQFVKLDSQQQKLSVYRNKHQKIRGVAGSGKTLVLAQRAVNAHIRHKNEVLILTYNITLRNYIHDNLNRVRKEFHWNNFHINHYHHFIISTANNLNIEISNLEDCDNEYIFEDVKDKIVKYQSIFIDEIQDYKESWIKIIKKYFLAENGEFVVFGDEKQNIYDIKLDNDKKPYTGISGNWNTLKQSHRLSNNILKLAEDFQKYFFKEKYELEKAIPKQQTFNFEEESINYFKLDNNISLYNLANFILTTMQSNSIQHQDVCILAHSNGLLRGIDYELRQISKQKTYTTFETQEMYDELLKRKLKEFEFKSEIRTIQKNKRFNFWMNSAGVKLSAINSFKGWEINTLFLIIDGESNFETSEKIYTALTRCRSRLFILNINHADYDTFFSKQQNITLPSVEIIKEDQKSKPNTKTIRESIIEDNISDFRFNFMKLRNNGSFNILILGGISGNINKFKEQLNNHLSKFNINAYEWNIDLWNNKTLKNKGLKSLRIGQSKYNLVITAQIHHHSSKGNKKQNMLMELISGERYIDSKIGCDPKRLLTIDNFIEKVDEYINENQSNV
jgi:hypothetical protein